jgi:hypothetical protein
MVSRRARLACGRRRGSPLVAGMAGRMGHAAVFMEGQLCTAWDNRRMVSVVHSLKPSSGEAEALERLCAGLPDAAAARAAEALALARDAYGDKQLGTGEAVLQHALGMALIVASLDLDADARIAALLFAASDHVRIATSA